MARPVKIGLEYFSHDTNIMNDKKIKLLKARHGLIGYAIYIRLLEDLYGDTGYYLFIDDDFNSLFIDDNNIDEDVYINVLNECIKLELFNSRIYGLNNILTSKRIQLNYLAATERRLRVDINNDYILFDFKKDNINNQNVYVNDEIVIIKKQSKVNKKKLKEIKVKNSKLDERIEAAAKLIEKEFNRILTPAEAIDIENLFNDLDPTKEEIEYATLISIQRDVKTIVYIRGIIEKERGNDTKGFKRSPTPSLEEAFGHNNET